MINKYFSSKQNIQVHLKSKIQKKSKKKQASGYMINRVILQAPEVAIAIATALRETDCPKQVCTCIFENTYLYLCVYTYMDVRIDAYMRKHVNMHANKPIYIQTCVQEFMHIYIHAYTHACINTYIHTYMRAHTCINSHIHTYMHTGTHTHTFVQTHTHFCIHIAIYGYISTKITAPTDGFV